MHLFEQLLTRLKFDPDHPVRTVREDKWQREGLSEKDIDKTLEESFPCSDPPAWY